MPAIKEYVAPIKEYQGDNAGYNAFDTLGRRVVAQYEAAGNDVAAIGKSKAAMMGYIGRWPFNIIELEQRAAGSYGFRRGQQGREGGGSRTVVARGGGSITDSQFAPRRMPNLAALNEMSEGAGAFGDMLGGGRSSGGSQLYEMRMAREARDARYMQQQEREQQRQNAMYDALSAKSWDKWQKELSSYNKSVNDNANKWYYNEKNPAANPDWGTAMSGQAVSISPVPNSQYEFAPQDIGGGSDNPPPPDVSTDYGGGSQSIFDWLVNGSSTTSTSSSGTDYGSESSLDFQPSY